jgi:flagellar biosynthesis chaperone FliJ
MTIKELEKKIKKQQKDINMLIELMNNSVEMLCDHKKAINSVGKIEEFNRKRVDNMEKCFDELLQNLAEGEYESENTIIH